MNQRKKQLKPLSDKQVRGIRKDHASGVHRSVTIKRYNISEGAYYKIVRRERYKEVV